MLIITVALAFDYLCFKCNSYLLCGDVELNPGPKENTAKKFTICHFNFNSIVVHNFSKLLVLKSYNSVHKFDKICLLETYLDSNILPDDSNFKIPGYSLVRSDHPLNLKREGVFYILQELFAFNNYRYQLFKRVYDVWADVRW